ncbi:YkgJ family cysteine cluster protein [bacterium]|nr:YkgJ family cysteine cluster protein [bacterium]
MENKSKIEPIKLTSKSRFGFLCHKGIECFTKCCGGIDIVLTPLGIIRMKNRLNLSCDEFLLRYTTVEILGKTMLPVVRLVMKEDEDKSCPFLDNDGCSIYEDRPVACRYYPVGMGALRKQGTGEEEDFYFLVKESHCLGFKESKKWSINKWREDQGIKPYDRANKDWMDIILRKKSMDAKLELSEKSQQMFFMVSSNVDKLKSFIFESSFLKIHDVDKEVIGKISADETELMKFGLKWLKGVLFGEDTVKIKDEAIEERKKK